MAPHTQPKSNSDMAWKRKMAKPALVGWLAFTDLVTKQ